MKGWMPYHFFEKKNVEICYKNEIDGKKVLAELSESLSATTFRGNIVFGDANGVLTYIQDPSTQPNLLQFSEDKIIDLKMKNFTGITPCF